MDNTLFLITVMEEERYIFMDHSPNLPGKRRVLLQYIRNYMHLYLLTGDVRYRNQAGGLERELQRLPLTELGTELRLWVWGLVRCWAR